MTETDKQLFIELIERVVEGFDGVRRDLRNLGGDPYELEHVADMLREMRYRLKSEPASADGAS